MLDSPVMRTPPALLRCVVSVVMAGAACGALPPPHPCGATPIVEHLTLQSREASLRAVLQRPNGSGRFPAVVLIHGSGRMTAEDASQWSARQWLDLGVAVMAYDKRGVGGSTGVYSGVGPTNSDRMFDLLADDALAAVAALKSHANIESSRIGLFANSQGGWIAPLAASRSRDVAFLISVSGPVSTVGEENEFSRLAGADPGSIQGLSAADIETRFNAFTGPHGFDPVPVLRTLPTPSLWIIGERDRSIPVALTLRNLEQLKTTHGRPITVHVMSAADHGMRDTTTGGFRDFWPGVERWMATVTTLRPCTR